MIEKIVKELLNKKVWTFEEISNINTLIVELTTTVYESLTAKEKLDLVWNENVRPYEILKDNAFDENRDVKFGLLFQAMVNDKLYEKLAKTIKMELSEATINFKENKNEISKRSVGGKPHKKRPTDEAADSEE